MSENKSYIVQTADGKVVDYTPISMWGYFGYQILFTLPVVGFICLVIFALTNKNQNVKNFARSYFCVIILVLILAVILLATGVLGGLLS